MTKSKFNELTKGMHNEIREINGIMIGRVSFHNNQWKIVSTNNFSEISPREYKPIKEFYLRDELYSFLKNEYK